MLSPLPIEVANDLRRLVFHPSSAQDWPALVRLLASADTLWATASDTVWIEPSSGVESPPAALLMVKTTSGVCGLTVKGEWADLSVWMREHPDAHPCAPQACLKGWSQRSLNIDKLLRHSGYTLSCEGIGLTFEIPLDLPLDRTAFEGLLISYSCHPEFARRIFQDLRNHGSRSTTVVGGFHEQLPSMVPLFASFGVRLTRSWPYPRPIPTSTAPYPNPIPNREACARALQVAYQAAINKAVVLST